MDYSTIKKIPFKGYARAYETTVKRLFGENDIRTEKVIQFGEFCEDKNKLPNYHEYDVASSKYIGIVKISIEEDNDISIIDKK